MDYFYEMKVITTSRIQARSIWKTMCRICEEKCLKKLDTFVEDIEKSCNLILKALQEEYDLQHVIADISNIIKEERPVIKDFVLSAYTKDEAVIPARVAAIICKHLEEKLTV